MSFRSFLLETTTFIENNYFSEKLSKLKLIILNVNIKSDI